eukprot:scaffold2084_cov155-Skeletonema_menzelii.AAC.7
MMMNDVLIHTDADRAKTNCILGYFLLQYLLASCSDSSILLDLFVNLVGILFGSSYHACGHT